MQNYMREQLDNPKSYNMVTLLTNYASEFLDHLYFPVAFDTFHATLDALLEFVQGPNSRNQEIVIQHNFVEMANAILKLEYNEEALTLNEVYGNKSRLSRKVSYLSQIPSIRNTLSNKDSGQHKFDFSINDIVAPANNFMTSLIKYKSLIVLMQLLVGKEHPSYIFYLIRRVIDPDTLRLNFAYQEYFRRKFHKDEYNLDLFFRYDQHIDQNVESPLIIEIGFLLYFLLMRMQENLFKDMDERYYEIVTLLSQKSEASSAVQKSAIIRFYEFCIDTFDLSTRCCKSVHNTISTMKVKSIQHNNFEMRRILAFYNFNCSKIEIIKEGLPQYQFFPILPFCRFRSEHPKEKFLREVTRTNAKTKCEDLMNQSEYMIMELRTHYWLRTGLTRVVGLFQKYLDLWKSFLTLFIIAINFIVLVSYDNREDDRREDPELYDLKASATKILLYVLGACALVFALNIFLNSVASKVPVIIRKYQIEAANDIKKKEKQGLIHGMSAVEDTYNKISYSTGLLFQVCFNFQLCYFFSLVVFLVLGLSYHPFCYTFMLTYLIYRSPTLINVLRAVWNPRKTIVVTIGMMLIVVYCFTVFSYSYYPGDYSDYTCYSLWTCFVASFDQTFKNDGGLGGYLESAYDPKTNETVKIDYVRVIYDNLAFFIVGILLIEIISGIIIDTFAELRQQNYDIQKDSSSVCFICDRTREELEKDYGVNGFEYHTNQEHNLWDYLFFVAYLDTKKNSEGQALSTAEKYVVDKLEEDDYTWLPCYSY